MAVKQKQWNVLVIEDDPDGQEVVQRILKHNRINNDITRTAESALDMLSKRDYNLAIVDLALPGMDGWRLLQSIKRNPRTANIPCIAVTAFHSAEVAVEAIEAGFKAYFPKPLDASSFVNELEQALV